MFMNNFTRSVGRAKFWQSTANLSCCSIDSFTKQFKSVKALAFIALFLFSIGSVLGQSSERTEFFNRCIDDLPQGLSVAAVQAAYAKQCEGSAISVVKTPYVTGDNCDWTVTYSYEIKCPSFEDSFKLIYYGGDRTAPVIDQLPEISKIECPDSLEFVQATASDNCGGDVALSFSDAMIPGKCSGSYTMIRTWTATDSCNNSSTATQTIEVEDNTDPVITGIPDISTIECPSTPEFTTPKALDTCDDQVELTYVDSITPGKCAGSYSVTRTWTATDDCGNTATAYQTINVEDTTAPAISSLPEITKIQCPAIPEFETPTVTDACDKDVNLTYVDTIVPGNCLQNYTVIRTWTATDSCGNSATASQSIGVEDNLAPVFEELPGESTITCPSTPEFAQPVATDDCGGIVTLTYRDVTSSGNCEGNYSVTRTWTANDSCGNSATASQTINVEDVTPPIISELPDSARVECPLQAEFTTPTVTDSCDMSPTLSYEDSSDLDECGLGTVTRTWTAMDDCGNISTASQTITIYDETSPVIEGIGEDYKVECPAQPEFSNPTASDTCDQEVSLTYADSSDLDDCGLGTVTRTWTATDCAGNSSTASQTITISDNEAPVINGVGEDFKVECPAQPEFSNPTASDSCDQEVSLTYADSSDLDDCGLGTVTRTWTATDCAGNSSTAMQTITISDNEAPVINGVGENLKVECPAQPEFSNPTAIDTCDGKISLTYVDSSDLDDCGLGTITRTWTATDCAGNSSTASQTILIHDNNAPIINGVGEDFKVECPAQPEFSNPTASDTCDQEVSLTYADSSDLDDCGLGTITRTWTATDCAGNSSTAMQTITIGDNTDPYFNEELPQNETVECNSVPELIKLTASDNCSDASVIYGEVRNDGNCTNNYTLTRTWTATDCAGNSIEHVQVITVQDTTAPLLVGTLPVGQSNINACQGTELGEPTEAEIAALFTDNCGEIEVVKTTVSLGDDCDWSVMFSYEVKDDCGNISIPIKIYYNGGDTTAPVRIGEIPIGESGLDLCKDSPLGEPSVEDIAALYTDNCGTIVVTKLEKSYGTDCEWIRQFEYTIKDSCGNGDETIKVNYQGGDTSGPQLIDGCPTAGDFGYGDVQCISDLPTGDDLVDAFYMNNLASFYTDCSNVITVEISDPVIDGKSCGGSAIYKVTVSDACKNISGECTLVINFNDTIAPVVKCPGDEDFGLNPKLDVTGIPVDAAVEASWVDNCQGEGQTSVYTDSDVEVDIINGSGNDITISCLLESGEVYSVINFRYQGNNSEGYAIYFATDEDIPGFPGYTAELNYVIDRYSLTTYLNGVVETVGDWFNITNATTASCESSDWAAPNTGCNLVVECVGGESVAQYSFVRTFIADDGCGNVGKCSTTYSWTGSSNAVRNNNQGLQTDPGFYGPTHAKVDLGNVDSNDVKLEFSAYPVPFDQVVNIKYNFEFDTDVTIDVHDTKGILILSEMNTNYRKNNVHVAKLDLSRGGDQIFYVTITTSLGKVTKKIVSSGLKRH